ncbi:DNA methyltransferase [Pyramidobacter piscolens]|uniref:DNA methyltransferase n=1 Tax=Pyramidobacter piscolens TaxID=638849 RepID=UPI002666561F|nr:site-specific DNA-methyltransferase [Pyramidobacter piscolens]
MFGREEFGYAKPEHLIKAIIEVATEEGDIVLDFHLGSGTTCAVAHRMGRRYIGIEQTDYIESVSIERLKKVIQGEKGGISNAVDWQGSGSFVYCELAECNQHFADGVVAAKSDADLIVLLERVLATGFIRGESVCGTLCFLRGGLEARIRIGIPRPQRTPAYAVLV